MGILNVTPDSFSDGGDFINPEKAAAHATTMLDNGARIIDIGGESTRPGSDPVTPEEEKRRVLPVIKAILAARPETTISIDTYRAATAEAALEAGADLVNDVSALRGDPRMIDVVAEARCPVVLMHMLGTPNTMQEKPSYKDVVREVRDFLVERSGAAVASGIEPGNIVLDPGIGFGKTLAHNLALLRDLDSVTNLGFPVLVGASRKNFLGKLTGAEEAKDRVAATVATTVMSYERGAKFFRVHDVRATADALAVAVAVCDVD
jgi:dihydropteroate synthase